jgi:hypothetical protein
MPQPHPSWKAGRRHGRRQAERGKPDRSRVAKGEGYEVNYFAKKHGITAAQARSLIDRVGNNRDKPNAAAEKLTKR